MSEPTIPKEEHPMPEMRPVEIPNSPEGWTTADPAAVARARTDGGLRASIARALWREGKQPSTNAQIGGYVYEIADKVAALVEQAVRGDELERYRKRWRHAVEAADALTKRVEAADATLARVRDLIDDPELKAVEVLDALDVVLGQANDGSAVSE